MQPDRGTKTEAEAKRAKAALSAGRSWASVASRFSIDRVSRSAGGKLTDVAEGTQAPALGAAIFTARKRTITGPVETRFGHFVGDVRRKWGQRTECDEAYQTQDCNR